MVSTVLKAKVKGIGYGFDSHHLQSSNEKASTWQTMGNANFSKKYLDKYIFITQC